MVALARQSQINLSPEEIRAYRAIDRLRGGDSLLDFIPRVNRGFHRADHLRIVADAIAAARRQEGVRVCVSVPPRHSKTETLIAGIPWCLDERPSMEIAYLANGDKLAHEKSVKARDITEHLGIKLRRDAKSKGLWRTPERGGLMATGLHGNITGFGFDLGLIDDPYKSRATAESPTIRDGVWDWFKGTFMSRIEPGGSVIVNMARWHQDDLIGRLSEDEEVEWQIINLPAIDPDTGLALWPERWPLDKLEMRRREVGPYEWASLYLGQPRPRGGALFPIENVARYEFPDVAAGARILIVLDPAATEDTAADHSAMVVMSARGYGLDQTVDVLEVVRVQLRPEKVIRMACHLMDRWGAPMGIEAVGGFKAMADLVRVIAPDKANGVFEITPLGDKFTRALPGAAAWVDGRVRLPQKAPWLRDFEREIGRFTGIGDAQDDQVDAFAHAFNAITRRSAPICIGSSPALWMPFG